MSSRNTARTRLYTQIVFQLQQEIRSGHLPSGARLPSERDLATQFGVSRASIREALSVLQSQRLIESRQGGGTIVRATPEPAVEQRTANPLVRAGAAIRDPLEVRSIFEPQTAYLAAARATNGEIAHMRDLLSQQETAIAAGGTGLEQDTAFHFAIAQAAHNELIVTIVSQINEALRETREWSLRVTGGGANSLDHHRRILAAIAAHDPAAAQIAMASHLEDVQMMALRWVQERALDLAPETESRPTPLSLSLTETSDVE